MYSNTVRSLAHIPNIPKQRGLVKIISIKKKEKKRRMTAAGFGHDAVAGRDASISARVDD
jgi:hypothetical protein